MSFWCALQPDSAPKKRVGVRLAQRRRGMRLITTTALLVFVFTGLTAAQDRATFTVGTATAARGQKARGTIEVPAGSDAALSIPVAVVHGAKPGPVLALVAGAHGTEYTSIIALEKLIGSLNPGAISG